MNMNMSGKIERHKYAETMVSMSVELYVSCGCGLRVVEKVLRYLNRRLEWNMEDIPSYASIKNWVEKSGYFLYNQPELKNYKGAYAQIVDESMMIGSEKLLLSLGLKADKTGDSALTLNEVEVLDISVRHSWNSKQIADVFSRTENKLGRKPAYIIGDNASVIRKAVRDRSRIHMRDVGHTMAMFVERRYKNEASFKDFTKDVAGVKSRENMRPAGYLSPPKQKSDRALYES